MKTCLTLCFSLALAFTAMSAETYSLLNSVIAGGGGTSTGGNYSLTGTIGQPDASPTMAGGNYTVAGGFWSVAVAIQMPGAPLLTITRVGNNVLITWPSDSAGFVLNQTLSLGAPNWQPSGGSVVDNGTTKTVTLPLTPGALFYRLQKTP